MIKNYSQEEVNKILLEKGLNEFYFSIIEKRKGLISDEEYKEITKRGRIIYGDNKEEVEDLFEKVESEESSKGFTSEIKRIIYSFGQVRHTAVLTMIDDNVYDIANRRFVDLKRNKIIHYDKLSHYFDETNARIKIIFKDEIPQLKQDTALLDVDDVVIWQTYEEDYIHQKGSKDLTGNFFNEEKIKPYIMKKRK